MTARDARWPVPPWRCHIGHRTLWRPLLWCERRQCDGALPHRHRRHTHVPILTNRQLWGTAKNRATDGMDPQEGAAGDRRVIAGAGTRRRMGQGYFDCATSGSAPARPACARSGSWYFLFLTLYSDVGDMEMPLAAHLPPLWRPILGSVGLGFELIGGCAHLVPYAGGLSWSLVPWVAAMSLSIAGFASSEIFTKACSDRRLPSGTPLIRQAGLTPAVIICGGPICPPCRSVFGGPPVIVNPDMIFDQRLVTVTTATGRCGARFSLARRSRCWSCGQDRFAARVFRPIRR